MFNLVIMNTLNKNDNTAVLIFVALFCVCCCCCCSSSIISSGGLFLKSDKKDEPTASPPAASPPAASPPAASPPAASPPAASPPAASPLAASPPTNVTGFPVGTPVKCGKNELRGDDNSVYRVSETGTLRHYPNPDIAASWDSDWGEFETIDDCEGLVLGAQMEKKAASDSCVETCEINTTSVDGKYNLVMQSDGNLVIYEGSVVHWATGTTGNGTAPYRLVMQGDGNLVIYDKNDSVVWSTGTNGSGTAPYRLVMQSDRNLVIYDKNDSFIWATGTNT